MTSVTADRCADGHVTGSRDEAAGQCAGVWLEGVAGPQQVGLRYELVVQSATTSYDGRCVLETAGAEDVQDSFFVQVLPGQHRTTVHCFVRRYYASAEEGGNAFAPLFVFPSNYTDKILPYCQ